jgi:Flp pilus assembly pilin Flp
VKKPRPWLKNAQGATAIEYSLIVAGLAVVIATAVFLTGGSLSGAFQAIETFLSGVNSRM